MKKSFFKSAVLLSVLSLFIFTGVNFAKADDAGSIPVNASGTILSLTGDFISMLQSKINDIKLQLFALQLNDLTQQLSAALSTSVDGTALRSSTVDPINSTLTPTATTTPPTKSVDPISTSPLTPTPTSNTINTVIPSLPSVKIDSTKNQIETLQKLLNNLQTQTATPAPSSVSPTPTPTQTPNTNTTQITSGISDIKSLQELLINNGYSIPAGATGYYGGQTIKALGEFQKANGLSESSPFLGKMGPWTRARILEKYGVEVSPEFVGYKEPPASSNPAVTFPVFCGTDPKEAKCNPKNPDPCLTLPEDLTKGAKYKCSPNICLCVPDKGTTVVPAPQLQPSPIVFNGWCNTLNQCTSVKPKTKPIACVKLQNGAVSCPNTISPVKDMRCNDKNQCVIGGKGILCQYLNNGIDSCSQPLKIPVK